MNNLKLYIIMLVAACCTLSCKEQLDVYSTPDNKLYFDYNFTSVTGTSDTMKRYTFVFEEESFVRDTIWVDVRTIGFVTDNARKFVLKQVPIQTNDIPELRGADSISLSDAVPGVHYVPFDSPEVEQYMNIAPNSNSRKVPLILLRDKSLKEKKHYIKLEIVPNENFTEGYLKNRYYTIEISDILVKPKFWSGSGEYYFLGGYSSAKLQFMINNSKWRIDEKWFEDQFKDYATVDMGYCVYLSGYYTNKLIEYNRERKARGEDVLRDENGAIVRFCLYTQPTPYI